MTNDSTINDVTTKTGLLKDETITTMSDSDPDMVGDQGIPGITQDTSATPPIMVDVPGAEVRSFDIGVVYDDDDDNVRLALVSKHGAGTKNVIAYTDGGTPVMGTSRNTVTIDHDDDNATADEPVPLKEASGTFMRVTGLGNADVIEDGTKPTTIYQYEDGTGETQHVRFVSSATDQEGVTTYTYNGATIRKGAKIPAAADYQHIHFGVWAALGTADEDSGEQDIAELGIAFVQNYMGGMTEEMPNNGTGEYSGNWVANSRKWTRMVTATFHWKMVARR